MLKIKIKAIILIISPYIIGEIPIISPSPEDNGQPVIISAVYSFRLFAYINVCIHTHRHF